MEKTTKIKTIDITAKEWFDKINGNSYFSALIDINYGLKGAYTIKLPFQYGYGDHYIDMAKAELNKLGLINIEKYGNGMSQALWSYCKDNKIILRTVKHENCLKRELN